MNDKKSPEAHWAGARDPSTFAPLVTVEVSCYHCGRTTIIPVAKIADAERDMWRDRYERLLGSLNEAIRISNVIHGSDPMREEFLSQLLEIRRTIHEPAPGDDI